VVLGEWGTSLVGDDAKWAEELATYLKAKVHLGLPSTSILPPRPGQHASTRSPDPPARSRTRPHAPVTLVHALRVAPHTRAPTHPSPACPLLQNLTSTFFWALNPAGEEGSGLIKLMTGRGASGKGRPSVDDAKLDLLHRVTPHPTDILEVYRAARRDGKAGGKAEGKAGGKGGGTGGGTGGGSKGGGSGHHTAAQQSADDGGADASPRPSPSPRPAARRQRRRTWAPKQQQEAERADGPSGGGGGKPADKPPEQQKES
jgi:hypothetical protein